MQEQASLSVIIACLFYWVYWGGSHLLIGSIKKEPTYQDGPVRLFASACGLVLAAPLVFLAGCVLVPLLIIAGIFGWAVLFNEWLRHRTEYATFRIQRPLPRLQFRLTDLYVATFLFAVVLTIHVLGRDHGEAAERTVPGLAIYLIVTGSMGFVVAQDVLRRRRPQDVNTDRSWVLLATSLWFVLTGGLGGVIAWLLWRRTLFLVSLEKWRKEESASTVAPSSGPPLNGPDHCDSHPRETGVP
jgi:uncharacterized membrane protein YsdA (DUF1294 family)